MAIYLSLGESFSNPAKHVLVIPWSDILGVRLFEVTTVEGTGKGLILGLTSSTANPQSGIGIKEKLESRVGPFPWENRVVISDENWDWDVGEVRDEIKAMMGKDK